MLISPTGWSQVGEDVTFTAAVTADGGTPVTGGSVSFVVHHVDDGPIDDAVPTAVVAVIDGRASFTTSTLSIGHYVIVADYGGTAEFAASWDTGTTRVLPVPTPTTMTVTSSLNPSIVGESVTFTATATVTVPSGGSAPGAVYFRDESTSPNYPGGCCSALRPSTPTAVRRF